MGGRFNYMELPEPDLSADGPYGARPFPPLLYASAPHPTGIPFTQRVLGGYDGLREFRLGWGAGDTRGIIWEGKEPWGLWDRKIDE
jgi:hypothetical protein